MLRPCVRCQQAQSALRIEVSSVFWYVVLACHLEAGPYHVSGPPGHRFVLACKPWCLVHGQAPCGVWIQHRSELPLWSSPGNAQSGISWVQSLLFRAAPLAPTLTIRHLLFGFSNDELLIVPLVFVYLLNVLKFQIWVMRNNHRYRQVPPGAVGLIAATKSRLRFYLPLLAKRFLSSRRRRYFKRQWGPLASSAAFIRPASML